LGNFCSFEKKLIKGNYRPIGEKSPNLVTLMATAVMAEKLSMAEKLLMATAVDNGKAVDGDSCRWRKSC
jgi:hypothetical protein